MVSEETREKDVPVRVPKKSTKSRNDKKKFGGIACILFGATAKLTVTLLCLGICCVLLINTALSVGGDAVAVTDSLAEASIMDKYDMFMTNQTSNALDGVLKIEKIYWLSDSDLVAPEPDPENYGTAESPEELMWLLDEAAYLIGGQEMLFGPDRPVWNHDKIYYYYDETILVITWKEVIDNCTYTISEVKIAHPSQFRRFLADGKFGSAKQYVTTEMASSVNAVVASSGDFYKHRLFGVVVYEGVVQRFENKNTDTCFINDEGNLLFGYRGDFESAEDAQRFVEENNVRFSLAFGPILIDNGVECAPEEYALGEVDGYYSRMALCQRDELHYLLVNSTAETDNQKRHTVKHFAQIVESMGCEKAYALDGGQTTVITMDDRYINDVDYGFQRQISDIIYFATALPDGE